jgi:alpha-D-ribose 1-methylphosphonate 5-triphosphate synthase subunit PhnH
MASIDAPSSSGRLTLVAAVLAAAAVAVMVVLSIMDHDGPAWLLQPALGLAAAVVAWRAGGTSPRNPVAFAALLVGVVMTLIFLGWLIAEVL